VMLEGSRRLSVGETLIVTSAEAGNVTLRLLEACERGCWRLTVDAEGPAEQILSRIGLTPLPPYIRRSDSDPTGDIDDRSRYQTVYAQRPGAIAAPTAGLHLTPPLLDAIRARGVETTFVTLHVGVGTFQPIDVNNVSQYVMHAERYEVKPQTVEAVQQCRKRGGRVVAVGTTTVRVLESAAADRLDARTVRASSGMTDLFIYPPYRFRVVDALLTNFHLPQSTLLALVMALAGVENIRRAYRHAIKQKYRFYSYGDAMLIL
ncbi:MAG: tRNA preQ1(34) S-adenosylmethionine ribosyltransferase-isomerase QueA, partial [Phycisphaerae bacterium]